MPRPSKCYSRRSVREVQTCGGLASPAPTQASVVTSGIVGSGAETQVEVKSQNLAMTFTGQTTWPEDASLAVNGTAVLKAADFADALSVAGIVVPVARRGSRRTAPSMWRAITASGRLLRATFCLARRS